MEVTRIDESIDIPLRSTKSEEQLRNDTRLPQVSLWKQISKTCSMSEVMSPKWWKSSSCR